MVEKEFNIIKLISNNLWYFIINGLLILGISKLIWYECLRRLDISKAIYLSMTFPVFSLLILVFYFGETISWYQWIGIAFMMIGVFFSASRPSVDLAKTKYAN